MVAVRVWEDDWLWNGKMKPLLVEMEPDLVLHIGELPDNQFAL